MQCWALHAFQTAVGYKRVRQFLERSWLLRLAAHKARQGMFAWLAWYSKRWRSWVTHTICILGASHSSAEPHGQGQSMAWAKPCYEFLCHSLPSSFNSAVKPFRLESKTSNQINKPFCLELKSFQSLVENREIIESSSRLSWCLP